jgi:Cdc25 family phosphatase
MIKICAQGGTMAIRQIQPHVLADWIRSSRPSFIVVDVRDHDYQDGRIKGSMHIPSTEWERRSSELLDHVIKNQITNVIFHCTFSAVRGPTIAKSFSQSIKEQYSLRVHVLQGGWSAWSSKYGSDPAVTDPLP